MRAAVYRTKGPAREVLHIEDLPTPEPGPGEVRVRIAFSGVNPSDVKTRARPGLDYPAVVPHSDGAGTIEAVGPGVPPSRLGQRVWLWNGQWERALGTAAEAIALPARQAVPLPEGVDFATGASIGIPLMTAFHAVATCGSLLGRTVLVPGAAGAVGLYATQLARLAGATVIAVVSSAEKAALACTVGAHHAIDYRRENVGERVRALTDGRGADALIEVDAAANAALWGDCLTFGATVVVYGSGQAQIQVPFRPLIVGFLSLHFFIVYRLPEPALQAALTGIGALLARGTLQHPKPLIYPLDEVAAAHEAVERGAAGKVLVRP
jgi:NADPH2:quinone reductase